MFFEKSIGNCVGCEASVVPPWGSVYMVAQCWYNGAASCDQAAILNLSEACKQSCVCVVKAPCGETWTFNPAVKPVM